MKKCKDCKKILKDSRSIRCNSCAQKERFKFSKPWNYKGLEHVCIECGNKISKTNYYYGSKKCKLCSSKGELNNFYGRVHSKNTRKKMSKIKIIHGMGYEPYPLEFNDSLKELIRKRDNYICQNCNITEEKHLSSHGQVLHIHHIDYCKHNCKKSNLITLCYKCNMKANKNRDYWYAYFVYLKENNLIIDLEE